MATFDQFITSIRTEFGEQGAGKKFETFCKWFLENDPEWSRIIDKVWLWDDYPNKWQRQDLGTDLVFRDNEGLIWAVQAKCYGEHRTTTKGDMNSFLADTGRKEVDRRLWLQTTNKIEAKAEKTLKGQDKPTTVFMLNDFRDAQIDYPASFADLYKAKVKDKPKPDPHQIKAIEDVTAGLRSSERGQMIMACGTGKTFTTLWIKEALEAHTTLVLLPSLSLLSQTMREWAWAGNTDFDILNVCSDKSVGKKTEDMDPADAPFPVTSDVEEIATFLKQPNPRVVFCTYQSSDLIAQAQLDNAIPTFDLAIADEAHRCAGKADAGFATILDGYKIRAVKRLFTTATPRYFGNAIRDEARARDLAVVGMDDEDVFGPVIHRLTFGQAIEQELLTDLQVVIVGVDQPMVRQWIENYEIVSTDPDNQTDARTLAAKIGLLKAIRDYDLQRVISFHSRVSGAKQFSDELHTVLDLIEPQNRPSGNFLSDYVSGEMKAGDRKDKIDRLKALEGYDRGILTNARCLAEGVDVPSLDGVAFIDPRGSQVEIIQAVGRAIRKVRGAEVQKKGTIVLPVFIEGGDDHEASIEASNFKPVWDILKALRAHDEVLADTLDQYRTNMAQNTFQISENISDKIIFDLPLSVDVGFSSALRAVLVEASTTSWSFWFGLLLQFKNAEGHCNVKYDYTVKEYRLGAWVTKQRSLRHFISLERKQKLDGIGFIWDPASVSWNTAFIKLAQFKALHGHCGVPQKHKVDALSLGGWVSHQRIHKDDLSNEQILKLDNLGMCWDPILARWNERYQELEIFFADYGHTKIAITESKLGTWIVLQRQRMAKGVMPVDQKILLEKFPDWTWEPKVDQWHKAYQEILTILQNNDEISVRNLGHEKLSRWLQKQRSKKDLLSNDQKRLLESLRGFFWDPHRASWLSGFEELSCFIDKNGRYPPQSYVTKGGFALGTWTARIRSRKNLKHWQSKLINSLPHWSFNKREQDWLDAFNNYSQYVNENGSAKVPAKYLMDGSFDLGRWVTHMKKTFDTLDVEKKALLEGLSGWSKNYREDKWNEGYIKLTQFISTEGHASPPQGYMSLDGFRLGIWVSKQRHCRSLSEDRIRRLEELDGWKWNPNIEGWDVAFELLKQYEAEHGNCSPKDKMKYKGYTLASWIYNQKQRYKKGILEDKKVRLLESLASWVW